MRKKRNFNGILILIVIIAILIVITIINIMALKNQKEEPPKVAEENAVTEKKDFDEALNELNQEFIENGEIVPENYNFLVRIYEGPIKEGEIYSKLYDVIYKHIPELLNNLYGKTDNEIIEYMNQNRELIKSNFGIEYTEDLINLVKKMSDTKDATYASSVLDIANIRDEGNYSVVDLNVKYNNNTDVNLVLKIINEYKGNESTIIVY